MDDKKIDNLFREKLYPHSSPVEERDVLWRTISTTLDRHDGERRLRRKRGLLYACSSVAAVIIVGIYLFAPNSPKPYIPESSVFVAEAVPVEKHPETTTTQPFFKPGKQPMKKKTTIRSQENVVQPQGEMTSTTDLPASGAASNAVEYVAEVGVHEPESSVPKISDDFEELWNGPKNSFAEKKKTKYLLALASNFAAGNNSGALNDLPKRALMAAGANGSGGLLVEQVSKTKYSLPLNLGLQLQVRVNSLLAIGAGVCYTRLGSKYDGLIDKKMHSVEQTLHYIGVPINIYATLLQKNGFFVYANAGGAIEKGVRASYSFSSYDGTSRHHNSMEGVQFSVNFGLGAEYRFIKQLGLYLEPNAVYFFNSKVPNSIRTDQPFQLKAEIGFRLHL